MTELEELEQRALTAIEDGFGNSLWATDLAQSRVGAAFDQARERQARFELMGRGADSWTNERVK